MGARFLTLGLVFLTACAPDWAAVIHVEFTGALATAGGGYRLSVLSADGAPVGDDEAQFIEFQAGTPQDAAVVIDDEGIFSGTTATRVRLYVQVTDSSLANADVLAVGVQTVELQRRQVVEATVELNGDIRPLAGAVSADFSADAVDALTNTIGISLSGVVAPDIFRLHAWIYDSALSQWTWLGAIPAGSDYITFTAPGAVSPLVLGDRVVAVTVESALEDGFLTAPRGWTVFSGALVEGLRSGLVGVLDGGASFEKMFALAVHGQTHADLALAEAGGAGDLVKVAAHAEHVYNIISGTSGAADLDGDSAVSFGGVTDDAGIAFYRRHIIDSITFAVENAGDGFDRTAILASASACAGQMADNETAALTQADKLAKNPGVTEATLLSGMVQPILGASYDAGAADVTTQAGYCLYNRVAALSVFGMGAVGIDVPPGGVGL